MIVSSEENLYLVPTSALEMLARTLVKMTLEVQCSYQKMEGESKCSINFLGCRLLAK